MEPPSPPGRPTREPSTGVDAYLLALEHELAARGLSNAAVVAEARDHLQDAVERGIRSGLSFADAERRALARFGAPEFVGASYAAATRRRPLDRLASVCEAIWMECRAAVRSLGKAPSFTAAVLLTLALGVGASTAVFSVAYGVLWRPLPYRDASRVAVIDATRDYSGRSQPVPVRFSLSSLDAFRAESNAYQSVAMVAPANMAVTDDVGIRTVPGARVTADFFPLLEGRIVIGRALRPGDDQAVVVSERFWRGALRGVEDVVGRRLVVDSTPSTIVGVADATFQLPSAQTDVWRLVAPVVNPTMQERGDGPFLPIVRLARGATLADAQGEAQEVVDGLMRDYPTRYEHMHATARTLRDRVVGETRPALLAVLAAAGLLLVVACANTAMLFLVRRTARPRDAAVRAALGASRFRLAGHACAEAGFVAIAASTAGLALAASLVRALFVIAPASLPRLDAIHVDWRAAAFAAAAAAVTTMTMGLLAIARQERGTYTLKSGASANGSPGADRTRNALVVAELAVVMVLLVGAALFGRSLLRLLRTDIGVSTDHVAAAHVDLSGIQPLPASRQLGSLGDVLTRVARLPTVINVAATSSLPPNAPGLQYTMTRVDEAMGRPTDYLVDAVTVTPRWFSALHVPLVAGRVFTDSDDAQHPAVMIMSRDTARGLFGAVDPLGRTMTLPTTGPARHETVTLVGIVANIKYAGLGAAPNGAIYRPFAQQPWPSMFVLAKTSGAPSAVADLMRPAIAGVDRRIDISQVSTLDALVWADAAPPRFRTTLVAAFAALAVIAGVGLYGVTAYVLSCRTTEMGIRIALGATRPAITAMVVAQALRLATIGVIVGAAVAYALSLSVRTLLFGIAPADGMSFAAGAIVLVVVSIAAAIGPARRAAHVDPVVALRAD